MQQLVELQISAFQLSVVSQRSDDRLIVGDYAEIKVSPLENDFYEDFRFRIVYEYMYKY